MRTTLNPNGDSREATTAGLRLPASQVRDERLRIALEMLSLTLRDAAVLPTQQQEQVREAVTALQAVQRWCKAHSNGD
jgi:hypothetical protein